MSPVTPAPIPLVRVENVSNLTRSPNADETDLVAHGRYAAFATRVNGEAIAISLLDAAGFERVRIEDAPVLFVFRGIDDYVDYATDTGGSFSAAFGDATPEEQAAIKRDVEERFTPFAVDGDYELPGVVLVAVAS